jgi:hypothetical protein
VRLFNRLLQVSVATAALGIFFLARGDLTHVWISFGIGLAAALAAGVIIWHRSGRRR